jgi:hypothetical protein
MGMTAQPDRREPMGPTGLRDLLVTQDLQDLRVTREIRDRGLQLRLWKAAAYAMMTALLHQLRHTTRCSRSKRSATSISL